VDATNSPPGPREDAPVRLRLEVDVAASPERIWGHLVEVSRWPLLHAGVDFAVLRGALEPGTLLHWRADGMRIVSVVAEADEGRTLGWTLRAFGGRGYQRWSLIPLPEGGTRVRLDESWSGLVVSILRGTLGRTLRASRVHWLEGLRRTAERTG
jgi:hypothetical protein